MKMYTSTSHHYKVDEDNLASFAWSRIVDVTLAYTKVTQYLMSTYQSNMTYLLPFASNAL